MKFAKCLKEVMGKMSQKELAKHANLSQAYISDILYGRRLPSVRVFVGICRALAIKPSVKLELLESLKIDLLARWHEGRRIF